MADIEKTREQPIEQFWEMTDAIAAGMLGIEGSGQHMQPMHPNCDVEADTIWFFTKKDSDLAQTAGNDGGKKAQFCVVGSDHDYHACVSGHLTLNHDAAIIDRFWNPITSAWFDGKDDPNLTLLKLELDDGVAWGSVGTTKFGWEIIKSSVTDQEPDVGARQHFKFGGRNPSEDLAMAAADGPGDPRKPPRGEGQF